MGDCMRAARLESLRIGAARAPSTRVDAGSLQSSLPAPPIRRTRYEGIRQGQASSVAEDGDGSVYALPHLDGHHHEYRRAG